MRNGPRDFKSSLQGLSVPGGSALSRRLVCTRNLPPLSFSPILNLGSVAFKILLTRREILVHAILQVLEKLSSLVSGGRLRSKHFSHEAFDNSQSQNQAFCIVTSSARL